tara:strand:+ start:10505 stop:10825 length:321 start_codon:yes stop_codon:yes gene_type:complete
MAIKYYLATNTGKGFITHADSAAGHIAEHPGGVFTTEHDHTAWVARVGAVEKTKEEAQALCDATLVDETGSRMRVLESVSSSIDESGNRIDHPVFGSDLEVYANLP